MSMPVKKKPARLEGHLAERPGAGQPGDPVVEGDQHPDVVDQVAEDGGYRGRSVVSRIPNREMKARITRPQRRGAELALDDPNTLGNTLSRAIDREIRADGQQGGLGGAHRRRQHGDDHDVADPAPAHLLGEVEEDVGPWSEIWLGRDEHLGGDDVERNTNSSRNMAMMPA